MFTIKDKNNLQGKKYTILLKFWLATHKIEKWMQLHTYCINVYGVIHQNEKGYYYYIQIWFEYLCFRIFQEFWIS